MKEELAVIVPIYNAGKYIEECVQSIIAQTYKDIEIILVDDGSTDDSYTKCKALSGKDKRIRVLHQENGGVLSAKQYGLEHTSASYIMFVDADDFIMPDMCESLYTVLKRERVDMVASGIMRWFTNDNIKYDYNNIPEGRYAGDEYRNYVLTHMLCNGVFSCWGIDPSLAIKIFKRDILYPVVKRANQEYGHLYLEDTAVTYPYMLEINSVFVLRKCFYYHRQYENHESVYLDDPDYEDKIQKIYHYLERIFCKYDNAEMLYRQLDHTVYAYYCLKYLKAAEKMIHWVPVLYQYLFPFDLIPCNCNILLYGAGKVGQSYYAQLRKLNYCKEIIWEDKNWINYQKMGFPVQDINTNVQVDYCVIAVQDKELSYVIADNLTALGMNSEIIIWRNPLLNMW